MLPLIVAVTQIAYTAMPTRSAQLLVRVTIIIPLTSPEAVIYANGVLTKLEDDFSGTTHSWLPRTPKENSPFRGTWKKEEERAEIVYREQIFILTVDADVSKNKVETDFDHKPSS